MSSLTHLDSSNSFTTLRTEGQIKVLCTSMDNCLAHFIILFCPFIFLQRNMGISLSTVQLVTTMNFRMFPGSRSCINRRLELGKTLEVSYLRLNMRNKYSLPQDFVGIPPGVHQKALPFGLTHSRVRLH